MECGKKVYVYGACVRERIVERFCDCKRLVVTARCTLYCNMQRREEEEKKNAEKKCDLMHFIVHLQ